MRGGAESFRASVQAYNLFALQLLDKTPSITTERQDVSQTAPTQFGLLVALRTAVQLHKHGIDAQAEPRPCICNGGEGGGSHRGLRRDWA